MPRTLLLGAEGCAELSGFDWIRKATFEEGVSWRFKHPETTWHDPSGRPYFLMTVLDHAPAEAREAAFMWNRCVRLSDQ